MTTNEPEEDSQVIEKADCLSERLDSSTQDEIFVDLQTAIFAPVREPRHTEFLDFTQNELPQIVMNILYDPNVWVEFKDGGRILGCRSLQIGSSSKPKQTRTHKHGEFDYRFETRSAKSVAYIDFCHPSINDIWGDVRGCAITAAVAAVIAAALTENYATAKAVFYPVFVECLRSRIGSRANEVTVNFHTDSETGCWENHC